MDYFFVAYGEREILQASASFSAFFNNFLFLRIVELASE